MDPKQPTARKPEQYPERDKVDDLDRGGTDEQPPQASPRDRQERGNAGPDTQPAFGQGA